MKLKIYLSLVILCFSGAIFADPEVYTHRAGMYVEGNVGTLAKNYNFIWFSHTSVGGLGENVNIGYQFNPFAALEVGGSYYDFNNNKHTNNGLGVADLVFKGIVPLTERAALFAKAGGGLASKGVGGTFYAGVGASYAVTQNLDVSIQMNGPILGIVNVGLISAGLSYHFA